MSSTWSNNIEQLLLSILILIISVLSLGNLILLNKYFNNLLCKNEYSIILLKSFVIKSLFSLLFLLLLVLI